MPNLKNTVQVGTLNLLRRIAKPVRQLLTPPQPSPEFTTHEIKQGPIAGCSMILPANTEIAEIMTVGAYEPVVVKLVSALVRPADTCIDIGGHYGYYTLCLAAFARDGAVHTYEPVPAHAERIRQAAQQSRFSNVTVHAAAVSDQVGEAILQMAMDPSADDSMAYLAETGGVHSFAAEVHYSKFSPITVRTTTLSEVISEIGPPNFIKIDAEGAEVAIVEAALDVLDRYRPRLLIETHGVAESLLCAEHLRRIGYCGVLTERRDTTMPVLWVSRDDQSAIDAARSVFGREPVVVCRDNDRVGADQ